MTDGYPTTPARRRGRPPTEIGPRVVALYRTGRRVGQSACRVERTRQLVSALLNAGLTAATFISATGRESSSGNSRSLGVAGSSQRS
jgi:hypothetical protein